jgi:cyclophilin family peptidyl-prolyl cis-trans isomerase
LLLAISGCRNPQTGAASTGLRPSVSAVPEALRQKLNLAPFYQRYIDAGGLPVLGSSNVSDYALLEARWVVLQMTAHRPEILRVMATNNARLVVMAHNEYTTDVPEHANRAPKIFWDRRARGLGGRVCSCGEENLLGFPGDPYASENILIHEFGHAIANVGMRAIDPGFRERLREAYEQARKAGLWERTYAGSNVEEYWAEGVQDWFDNNRRNDAQHNHVATRSALKQYDPPLAALCAEVFGEIPWRYQKPAERPSSQKPHLTGFDPARAPRFQWRQTPLTEKPRVRLQTSLGDIEIELFAQQAPVTVKNFLRYVLEGFYRDGEFFRAVTLTNQPDSEPRIEIVQAQATAARRAERFPAIPLERTRDTGIQHLDGTLSMARDGPNTGQDSFAICIGDQPELDFGGKRHPDGQGFAAFGRVVRGMDVVRRVHQQPSKDQQLLAPVRIEGAYRIE